jgi:hypothetical protein
MSKGTQEVDNEKHMEMRSEINGTRLIKHRLELSSGVYLIYNYDTRERKLSCTVLYCIVVIDSLTTEIQLIRR